MCRRYLFIVQILVPGVEGLSLLLSNKNPTYSIFNQMLRSIILSYFPPSLQTPYVLHQKSKKLSYVENAGIPVSTMCMKFLLCIIIKVNGAIVVKRSVFFNSWILRQHVVTCVYVYTVYMDMCVYIYIQFLRKSVSS